VYWVGLAALRDSGLVVETIAKAVGSTNGLAEHIGEREVLLLLDNFEQVVDAAPAVSALLGECPRLRVLVTSRDLLRIRGEREYPVPPLAGPEAIELFRLRSGVGPSAAVADLCSRLDRLPLAVELAAARSSVLSPAQILERLGQRLDLLTGGRDADPRQQTLRATIAWSYDLLDEKERALFARLAVFRGGCTLEAATEVADATVDGLQSLVDKSLLRHTDERFWQLETIRDYARERLGETRLDDDVRRRHAGYFLGFAEEIRRGVDAGGSLVEPGRRVAAEHDNLRSALEWARDTDQDDVLMRLTAAVAGHWVTRGLHEEADIWVALALDQPSGPLPARVTLLRHASRRALSDGDLALARDLIGQFRVAAEEAGDTEEVERAIGLSASLAWSEKDFDGARRLYLEVHDAAAQNGHDWIRANTLINLGFLHIEVGDYQAGLEYSNAAADLLRADEEESGLVVALLNGGCAQLCLGDPAGAAASLREALVVAGQLEATHRIANLALLLGAALIAVEDVEHGAQLLGAGTALCAKLDIPPFSDELEREIHEQAAADAKEALDQEAYADAWERGAAMTADDIVRFAMGDEPAAAELDTS
jgi:predicted ATPase